MIDIISTLTLLLSEKFSFMGAIEKSAISIVGLKHCIHLYEVQCFREYNITITYRKMIWETSFLNGCPLNAGNSTPNCDLQISLGKTRSVSTNLFMLSELLSDDSKLHPAKHVD